MRRLLFVCAVALLGFASSAAAAPHVREFSASVPAVTGHSAGTVTRAVRPGQSFDLAGVSVPRGASPGEIRLRAHGPKGWTHWVAVGFENSSHSSEPAWTGRASTVQVRFERAVKGAKVHFVRVDGRPTYTGKRVHQSGPQPTIIPRSQWAGDQCKPRSDPEYGSVQLAFVHHTVSANDYSPADSAAIVLGVCRYHRDTNGWNDIGYNFLVDQYGQIFEGRAGGIDKAVIGAQAQGYNSVSTGIAALGTYSDTPFPDAGVKSIANVIAWKLPLMGAPTTGTVTVKSGGGSDNRYPSGTPVTLNRISGHRDGDQTECPGNALYAQLDTIRALVGNLRPDPAATLPGIAPTATALQASAATASAVVYPAASTVSGRLVDAAGQALVSAPVKIDYKGADGQFHTLATATTAADGTWTTQVSSAFSRTLRATYGGDGTHKATTSKTFDVKVSPAISIRRAHTRIAAGRRFDLRGTVRPAKTGVLTMVVEKQVGSDYVRTRSVKVKLNGSAYRAVAKMTVPGLYRFHAVFKGDSMSAPSSSDQTFIRVTRTAGQKVGGAG